MADPPTNERVWGAATGPLLHAALLREQKRRKVASRSELVRLLLAEALGDASLAESRRGRPPKGPPAGR